MKRFTLFLVLAFVSSAFAEPPRTPIATIASGVPSTIFAAQNGILAIATSEPGVTSAILVYEAGTWSQIAALNLGNSNIGVTSLAIQNDYVAAGIFNDSTMEGAVYIFQKPQSGWADEGVTAILTPTNQTPQFGAEVAVWGNTLIVSDRNVAHIFVEPKGAWVNGNQTADLTASDNPSYFGAGVAIAGPVGAGGCLAVVGSSANAYVFVEPEGGWNSMTQTAELGGNGGAGRASAAQSTIAFVTPGGSGSHELSQIYIYTEPKGGWVDASNPNFTATASTALGYIGVAGIALSQNAQVLAAGVGSSDFHKDYYDWGFLWHANKGFGSSPIRLSTEGVNNGIYGATVAAQYAYTYDRAGNVYVFDGK
jgi:hypothetical protein